MLLLSHLMWTETREKNVRTSFMRFLEVAPEADEREIHVRLNTHLTIEALEIVGKKHPRNCNFASFTKYFL